MDEEIHAKFEAIEKRLGILEDKLGINKDPIPQQQKLENDFSGISKGIWELIQEGFFDKPRGIDETIPELSRKGFFGERGKIDSSIRKTFFGTKKILDRMGKDGSWKYFKRK